MTPPRLTLLLVVLLLGFSTIFVLPRTTQLQPAGIRLHLPQFVGKWYGVDQQVTARELEMLASDTEFARKLYTDGAGNAIFASIVLSGADLDNSIHRPERCLPAQGWTIAGSKTLEVPLASGQELGVTRLHDVRQLPLRDGRTATVYNLNYYWFIGYHHLTPSHLERELMDVQDRVLKGYNQRWAYITVAAEITKGVVPFGKSEAETDQMLQNFIRQIFPAICLLPNEQPPANARVAGPQKQVALSSR